MNKTPSEESDDVIIIGAGPAGLTAGYILTRDSRLKVRILEADPVYVGGISRTEDYKGFLFDIGGHRFFSKSKEIEDLWNELLPKEFLQRPRSSKIYYKKRFYRYPLHAFEVLKNLGLWESFLCVTSYIRARLCPLKPVRSFQDWVTNKFGARLFRIFFKTYTEKVWGIPCSKISVDWAEQRIKGLNMSKAIFSAIVKSLNLTPKKSAIKTLIESFHYPRQGPGMMWKATANKIQKQGGVISLGEKATQFHYDDNTKEWTITTTAPVGQTKTYKTHHVISSAPLKEVIESIEPQPSSKAQAEQLRYRDFILIALMLNTAPAFDDNWIYIHDPQLLVGRIQNYKSWSPEMVPGENCWCVGMEYFCFEKDSFWNKTNHELIELAKNELSQSSLATRESIFDACVVRQKKAYPIYDDGYQQAVKTIRDEIAEKYPTLHFIGRNGMHKYNNQDHAMMTGLLTAKNIMAGSQLYSVWSVNEDAEYHEHKNEGA